MSKKLGLDQARMGFRALILAGVVIVAGCATPVGAPCSNWSAICGCYCGAGGTWSGVEQEPPAPPPGWVNPILPRPDQKMSAQDKTSIRTVYIDRNVALPQKPRVQTRTDSWVEGYGGLIAVIGSTNKSKEYATIEYLEKNNIRIGEMLVNAFTSELVARNKFSVVTSPTGADAVIKVVIHMYGVEHTFNPFSNNYRTLLNAKAMMVGPGDKMIWIKEISVESDDQSLSTLEELYSDPESMRKHMSIVAKICAKRMVDHLSGTQ
jgi:hypothetical protein